jgi:hypothetical protein
MVQNSITPKLERDRSRPDRRAQQGVQVTHLEGDQEAQACRGAAVPRMCS